MVKQKIEKIIGEILERMAMAGAIVSLEHPEEISHGDYSSNVALAYAKKFNISPMEFAKKIVDKLNQEKLSEIEKIEIAGPGFINFFLKKEFFVEKIGEISKDKNFGKSAELSGKKIILDYTDPNPFKEFHIGHLMSNAIGESISRLLEFGGAEVKRICYQGDVGLHVAKAVKGFLFLKDLIEKGKAQNTDYCGEDFLVDHIPSEKDDLKYRARFLGVAYSMGANQYTDNFETDKIIEINKKIYDRSDPKINKIYDDGKKISLEYFDVIYKRLGTKFDKFIFESETGELGKKIVEEGFSKGIFEKSDGAVVYKGENYGLHTRVFINSEGLPTYEAKDLGLAKIKHDYFKYDQSIVITGNEVNDYFKVMLSALGQLMPELAEKTKHIGHGMLRLPAGKMSSRTGDVITAESLISKVKELVLEKMKDREMSENEKQKVSEEVAIGAIKYSILKQSIGGDIIFDFDKSISFEGDSGPYLQYAHTRAESVLTKAKNEGVVSSAKNFTAEIGVLERMIVRFPEIAERAREESEPHLISTYLMELSGAFNAYYAQNKIVNKDDENSSYKVALTSAFINVMKNGLWLLGISVPKAM